MISDAHDPRPVTRSERVFHGPVWDVRRDTFTLAEGGQPLERDYLVHPGAVAIVALDEQQRVLLLRQYRHPVRASVWGIPAGLLDQPGEDYHRAAARELAEEADLRAGTWRLLNDVFSSEGATTETLRIYLATDVSPILEGERHQRTDEEAEIVTRWVPLEEAQEAVLDGGIHSATATVGILAAAAVLRRGSLEELPPAQSSWPERAWVPSVAPRDASA